MPIKNYTTTVPVAKSVQHIQDLLASKGALSVLINYEGGIPKSISFMMDVNGRLVPFRLEANAAALLKALERDRVEKKYQSIEHAEKVAWRLVLNWIDVQLAFIEAGQAALAQLLLGYVEQRDGQTFWQFITEHPEGRKLLAEHL